MSYAVIKTGGKQYSVIEGQTLLIERLPDDVGATVQLTPLLLAGDGDPIFEGDALTSALVDVEIVEHLRGPEQVEGLETSWHIRKASAPAATAATRTPSTSA